MFRLLVIADIHYASDPAAAAAAPAGRQCLFGCELLRRAVEDARRGGPVDAIALMGDLINDSRQPNALGDLRRLRDGLRTAAADTPLLVVGGNHDNEGDLALDAFEFRPGLVELGGIRFLAFSDAYGPDDSATRRQADRQLLLDAAARDGGPVVVLQHNPMNPPIDDDYPFMLTNREPVLAEYARAGVLLSISGHYHAGQPLNRADGVLYFTAAALAERPFSYAVVSFDGRRVSVEPRRLWLGDGPALVDTHVHTQFAYCAPTTSAAAAIQRARAIGLAGVFLTEHAPQLYCQAEEFWVGRHVREPAVWRHGPRPRMAEFRREMDALRGGSVRIGLEVELDADGELTVLDGDRQWADRLVGAVHFLPEDAQALTDAGLKAAFLRTTEALLAQGVAVLAHPLRLFGWAGRAAPTDLYAPLADMLAATGTAAEVNFHINRPDAAFFAACIERGVKLAVGSDAHEPWEVGSLVRHDELIRQAAGRDDIAGLLLD